MQVLLTMGISIPYPWSGYPENNSNFASIVAFKSASR